MQRLVSQVFVPRVSPNPHVKKNFGSRFITLEIPEGLGPDDPEAKKNQQAGVWRRYLEFNRRASLNAEREINGRHYKFSSWIN